MSAVTIQQMAERVASLMEERLGVRGKGLSAKMRRGGRLLPRKVRAAATELADLADKAANPKLLVQIDQARVAACYDICVKHLSGLNRSARLMGYIVGVAATLALGLLILGIGLVVVQRMRGQL